MSGAPESRKRRGWRLVLYLFLGMAAALAFLVLNQPGGQPSSSTPDDKVPVGAAPTGTSAPQGAAAAPGQFAAQTPPGAGQDILQNVRERTLDVGLLGWLALFVVNMVLVSFMMVRHVYKIWFATPQKVNEAETKYKDLEGKFWKMRARLNKQRRVNEYARRNANQQPPRQSPPPPPPDDFPR